MSIFDSLTARDVKGAYTGADAEKLAALEKAGKFEVSQTVEAVLNGNMPSVSSQFHSLDAKVVETLLQKIKLVDQL